MTTPRWSLQLEYAARGLSLARETNRLLIWDEQQWLFWTNEQGQRQAQVHLPNPILTACISEEGSVIASAEADGRICLLGQDLQPKWNRRSDGKPTALALDPLGIVLAYADDRGQLIVLDREGRTLRDIHCPRPAHYLAFVPGSTKLLVAADFGWLAAYDLERGDWQWRDTPVIHIGGMAVAGVGEPMLFSVFSEGIRGYCKKGQPWKTKMAISSCRMVSVSYDGTLIVALEMDGTLAGLTAEGTPRFTHRLDSAPVAMALDAWGNVVYVALASKELLALEIQ